MLSNTVAAIGNAIDDLNSTPERGCWYYPFLKSSSERYKFICFPIAMSKYLSCRDYLNMVRRAVWKDLFEFKASLFKY